MEAEKVAEMESVWSLSPSVKAGLGWSRGSQGALSALRVWVTGDHKGHQEQRVERRGESLEDRSRYAPPSRGPWAQGEILKPISATPTWQVEFRFRRGSMPWAPVPAEIGQLGLQ